MYSNFTFNSLSPSGRFGGLFLSLWFFFLLPFQVKAQEKISLQVRNAPIQEVLKDIRKQSGFDYTISSEQIRRAQPVTLTLRNSSLAEVLDACFRNQPFTYQLKNKTVVVVNRPAAPAPANPQYRQLKGQVVDSIGNPLRGATIRISGTNLSTNTNMMGYFWISVPAYQESKLIISYLGYRYRELNVTPSMEDVGPIIMQQLPSTLQEVEIKVNTGYQTLDKQKATGSYSVVTKEDIEASPALSLIERLVGKTPGVVFDPKTNRIQIRTPNNFSGTGADNAPLVVIDGFPAYQNNLVKNPSTELSRTSFQTESNRSNAILNSYNPNDIESITFLKDAAATAIWGSRAANGVIVIETKKGKVGPTSIQVSAIGSVSAPANLNNLNVMNSADYIDLEKELFDHNFYTDPASHWRYPATSEAVQLMFDAKNGKITSAQLDAALAQLGQVNNRQQLKDLMLQSAQTQQYNLSLSGGNKQTTYHISGNYSKDRPVFRQNTSEAYFVNASVTNNFLNNRLTLLTELNQNFNKAKTNNAAIASLSPGTFGLRPYENLLDLKYPMFTEHVTDSFSNLGYLPWSYNALDELNQSYSQYNESNTRINASLTGKVASWLTLSVSGIYQRSSNVGEDLSRVNSYAMRDRLNQATSIDPTTQRLVYGIPLGGILKASHTYGQNYSIRFQANFNKSWGDHHVSLLAANEFRQNGTNGYTSTYYGYDEFSATSVAINPSVPYKRYDGGSATIGSQDNIINRPITRYLSYIGNLNYDYREKYYVSGSLRFDDYTQLGLERRNRAKPFWSAGARWVLSKEHFMQNLRSVIDNASIRFSAGTAGKVPTGAVPFSTFNYSGLDNYTLLPYGSIGVPGNRELQWETTRTINTGLDLGLLHNRLNATFDIYQKRSYGILTNFPVNPTYGWSTLTYNTANMKSNGVELMLEGTVFKSKDWTWDLSFNIAHTATEVTDNRFGTSGVTSPVVTTALAGYPIDPVFAYQWAGLNDKGQSQIYNGQGEVLQSSQYVTLSLDDFKYMGHSTPQTTGGFSQTLRYKDFTFSARISYQLGYKVLYDPIGVSNVPTGTSASGYLSAQTGLLNRWRQPGDETSTNIPGLINPNFNSFNWFRYADINVIDGDNIRLQQLSLTYAMPSRLVQRLKFMKSASIGFTASNLGLIWKKTNANVDPDYIFTSSYSSLRPSPTYTLNVSLSL